MIENLLLDIDGVCNCFHRHVFRHLGLPYPDDSHYPVDCGWNIVAAANRLAGYERFTPEMFWRSVTREVWAESPVSPEFGCLLEHAEWLVGTRPCPLPHKSDSQRRFACRQTRLDSTARASMDATAIPDWPIEAPVR